MFMLYDVLVVTCEYRIFWKTRATEICIFKFTVFWRSLILLIDIFVNLDAFEQTDMQAINFIVVQSFSLYQIEICSLGYNLVFELEWRSLLSTAINSQNNK